MNTLEEKLREHIRREGPITFARFMETALYDPEGGYYRSSLDRIGAEGDFYTSPVTHPVFGALISLQLEQMWQLMGKPIPFSVVEVGAGKKALAADTLEYVSCSNPSFGEALRYVAVERGGAGKDVTGNGRVVSTAVLPDQVAGCFLSNELIDALPTHLVTIREGKLREIYVALDGERLVETTGELSTPLLQEALDDLGVKLAEGQRAEINLEAQRWIRQVAHSLQAGFVLSIDYGYDAAEKYSERHYRGTLLCYHQHTYNDNPLVRVGRQDITSHVDFSALVLAGQREGLQPLGLIPQSQFLKNLGLGVFVHSLERRGLSWQDYQANRMAMLELVRPEGMGNFKVLVQSKEVGPSPLHGLTPGNPLQQELWERGDTLPVPLLKPHHVPLMKGKYPHYY